MVNKDNKRVLSIVSLCLRMTELVTSSQLLSRETFPQLLGGGGKIRTNFTQAAVATLPEAEHRAGLGWLLANSALCRQLVKALENDPKKLPAPALMPSARHDRGGKVDAFRWN
ncbi:putative WD repeat-containing protein [Trichinella pseudospiralis]